MDETLPFPREERLGWGDWIVWSGTQGIGNTGGLNGSGVVKKDPKCVLSLPPFDDSQSVPEQLIDLYPVRPGVYGVGMGCPPFHRKVRLPSKR